jgi:hypothetical protein
MRGAKTHPCIIQRIVFENRLYSANSKPNTKVFSVVYLGSHMKLLYLNTKKHEQ